MSYSKETKNIIKTMNRILNKKVLNIKKEKAEEFILKTYDLFDLQRPKKIVWFDSIEDRGFLEVVYSAILTIRKSRKDSFLTPLRAGDSEPAFKARTMFFNSSAFDFYSSKFSHIKWHTDLELLKIRDGLCNYFSKNHEPEWTAWRDWYINVFKNNKNFIEQFYASLDTNIEWYVFTNEYVKNKKNCENEYKYLKYCELVINAQDYGAGYVIELDDTLYLAPPQLNY